MANDKQARTIQGVTHGTAVVRLSHTDLTAAALTETILLSDLRAAHPNEQAGLIPANSRIMVQWINVIEEFAGGAVTACALDVGDAAADDQLMAAEDLFTGAGTGIKLGAGALTLPAFEAAYVPLCQVTTVTANVDALTAGEVDIAIKYEAITTDSLTG